MPANFVFRNSDDTAYVTNQDLGAIATGVGISPVQYTVKNTGDRVSVNTKVRIVANTTFQNTSGTPLLSVDTSSTLNPVAGTYGLSFVDNDKVSVNGELPLTIVADGETINTNIISGTLVTINATPSGSTAFINVNDGYERVQIALDVSGTPGTWNNAEIPCTHLFCDSMTLLSAALIPGGFLGQTEYFYVVTAITPKGETLISNEVSVNNNSPSQSAQLDWEVFPGAIGYNVYRSTTSGNEKFLVNTTQNTYVDDGTEPINNSISYPTSNNITSEKFWIRVQQPSGTLPNTNPRRFKLRAIGLSS